MQLLLQVNWSIATRFLRNSHSFCYLKNLVYWRISPCCLCAALHRAISNFLSIFQLISLFTFTFRQVLYKWKNLSLYIRISSSFLPRILSWLKNTKFLFDNHRPELIIFFLFLLLLIFFISLTRFLFLAIFQIFHIHLIVNSTHDLWISKNIFRPSMRIKTLFICSRRSSRWASTWHFAMVEDYWISYRHRTTNIFFFPFHWISPHFLHNSDPIFLLIFFQLFHLLGNSTQTWCISKNFLRPYFLYPLPIKTLFQVGTDHINTYIP